MLQDIYIFVFFVGLIALTVGSFLNVVIYRLPIMLKRTWRKDCHEFLEIIDNLIPKETFNLAVPRSRCPQCKHQIRIKDNIPVFSYLWLRGKCRDCQTKISPRYPLIEILTAILCITVAWHFGISWQALAGCILTCVLIAQSAIDLEHQIIPDEITLPITWLGLMLSLVPIFNDSASCIIGAVAGYLSLWLLYWAYYLFTKKEGMGQGDFKLLAMFGAWFGWQCLPAILIISSILGSIIGITYLVITKSTRNTPIPFGPFLASGAWIYLLWGKQLNAWYLNFSGIF